MAKTKGKFMNRQEKIEDLQDKVQHYRISKEELGKECEDNDIHLHDEVLEPIGFNTCDRCGEYGWSEQDFLWVDYFPWDEDNEDDKAVIKAMQVEGIDYCALCWDCVKELREKGREA